MSHFPCTSPVRLNLRGAPDVRCRRCENCREARRWGWYVKSGEEMVAAERTYMVTLTFGPTARRWIAAVATSYAIDGGTQQARLHRAARQLWKRYLKRLRKQGFKVRYLVVAEDHKNGWPHLHGLIFVQRGSRAIVTARGLGEAWRYGFTVVKTVETTGAIRYVTKYITKAGARVVTSRRYGLKPEGPKGPVEKDAYGKELREKQEWVATQPMPGHPSTDRAQPHGLPLGGRLKLSLEEEFPGRRSDRQ